MPLRFGFRQSRPWMLVCGYGRHPLTGTGVDMVSIPSMKRPDINQSQKKECS